jgi:hypothetical protein
MKTWIISVTETRNHEYFIEADTPAQALAIYDEYGDDQLQSKDLDGSISWDSPYEIKELQE